ncbi:MAG: hypothetical protein P9M12_01965 [Candidatus Aceula lacicola]|nr:hypothetical protein [Candidatus Aceula lacicola]
MAYKNPKELLFIALYNNCIYTYIMKSLLGLFAFIFLIIWGLGAAIGYVQKAQARVFSISPEYGDFSPSRIEEDRKKVMEDHKRQLQQYKNTQANSPTNSQEAQKRFMENQKRQMEDLKRQNQIR